MKHASVKREIEVFIFASNTFAGFIFNLVMQVFLQAQIVVHKGSLLNYVTPLGGRLAFVLC